MNIAFRRGRPTVERMVAAPAVAVWKVLTDLDAWPQWGPSVQHAELTEPGSLALGSHGTVWTPVGVALPFTITEFEPGRLWAWRVGAVPATAHGVEIVDGSSLVWMSAPLWAPAYLPVLAIALRRIDDMVA